MFSFLRAQARLGLPAPDDSVLYAAIIHDHGHPGVNNDFLIKTRDHLALTHNVSLHQLVHCDLGILGKLGKLTRLVRP